MSWLTEFAVWALGKGVLLVSSERKSFQRALKRLKKPLLRFIRVSVHNRYAGQICSNLSRLCRSRHVLSNHQKNRLLALELNAIRALT